MKKVPRCSALTRMRYLRRNLINPIPFLMDQQEKLGPIFSFPMGFAEGILLAKPEYVKYILQKNHKNYQKSKIQTDMLGEFIGKGLLTSNGDYWLRQRRLIQPGFHKKKLESITSLMVDEINLFAKKIEAISKTEEVLNIHDLMAEITFNIIAKSIFSDSLNSKEVKVIRNSITKIQKYFIKTLRQPFLKWYFNLSGMHQRHLDLNNETDAIIYRLINERKESGSSKNDLLDMLLNAKYEDNNEGMSMQQLRDEVLVIFAAGHETSANALSWLYYLLSKHPDVMTKLKEESESVIGREYPGFEMLNQLTYTKQVIQEALRMYPPAWIIDRVPIEEDEIDGYHIPKDVIIFAHVYAIHHDKDLWEDPETFNPDRFEKDKIKDFENFQYFPFGGGPRLCVGNNFAMMEMQLLVAMLAQKFEFKYIHDKVPEQTALITLQARYGIDMKINPVN